MSEFRRALETSVKTGLIMGLAAIFIALTGILEDFNKQEVVSGVISLGYALLALVVVGAGYMAARTTREEGRAHPPPSPSPHGGRVRVGAGLMGACAGLMAVGLLVALVLIGRAVNLRPVFVNATENLFSLLTFGQEAGLGLGLLLAAGSVLGAIGGILPHLPTRVRSSLFLGLAGVLFVGVLQELFTTLLSSLFLPQAFLKSIFLHKALSPQGAMLVFALLAGGNALWPSLRPQVNRRLETLPARQKAVLRFLASIAGIAVLLSLPFLLKLYWTDVIDNVGLYILMGLGLNIVVGFAGLLDLGYVAFFAIGAYAAGLFTSPKAWLGAEWSFWAAWPIAIAVAAFFGIVLGVPVLRMRGDYLAIVTLGFGEIIRVLALSDLLKPYIGGAQGILEIPKPSVGGMVLLTSQHLYYPILMGCLIAAFISWRLSDSRVGRAWIAIREDEDVARAMGINLVKYKLMAFAIGAAFSGMSGAIFASKLSSIYPHSFNLIISINVLCLIIVGGMASIPGVIVGALILVGLPEVLRFTAEYRFLMYGATLVVMMLVRPEGFCPAARRQRELREEAEVEMAREREIAIAKEVM
ncbi:MAG: branched-chain amino acid ABC transporter permease [Anaerolineae bacterium]